MTRRGFTIMEVLIAIALLIGLLAAVGTFYTNLMQSREQVLRQTRWQLAATTLIERIETDLMTSLVGDRRFGAGILGDTESLSIIHRSVAVTIADRGIQDPAVLGDLQRSSYRFDPARGVLEAARTTIGSNGRGTPEFWPLGEEIFRVRFRFHNGQSWVDSYDSLAANALPRAIEVAIWFRPFGPTDEALWLNEDDDLQGMLDFDQQMMRQADPFGDRSVSPFSDDAMFGEGFEPMPDRVRVIAVPDAAAGDDDALDMSMGSMLP